MLSSRFRPVVAVPVLVILAILLAPVASASANGDAVEIFRSREGSYEIVVRVLPEEPVVGIVHFSITPLEASTALPVTDAEILIVANDQRGQPKYQARALNTPASPQNYDANITFESAGSWTLVIEVQSDRLGEVTVTGPLAVAKQSIGPGSSGGVVFLVLLVVLVGGSFYVWYSARHRRAASG